jgi:hypothetical protein
MFRGTASEVTGEAGEPLKDLRRAYPHLNQRRDPSKKNEKFAGMVYVTLLLRTKFENDRSVRNQEGFLLLDDDRVEVLGQTEEPTYYRLVLVEFEGQHDAAARLVHFDALVNTLVNQGDL